MCTLKWLRKINNYLFEIVIRGAAARSAKKILCALCLPRNNDHCACKHKISQLLDDDLFNCFCLCQINYKCLQFFSLTSKCNHMDVWQCCFYLLFHDVHSACSPFWGINFVKKKKVAWHLFPFVLQKQKQTTDFISQEKHNTLVISGIGLKFRIKVLAFRKKTCSA